MSNLSFNKNKILEFILLIILCFCCSSVFYFPYIKKTKQINQVENELAKIKIQNFELNEKLYILSTADLDKDIHFITDSISERKFDKRKILVIRLYEELCMNCFFNPLQEVIRTINENKSDDIEYVVLGKYRFDTSFSKVISEIGLNQFVQFNTRHSFSMDQADCPYIYLIDQSRMRKRLFLIQKEGNSKFRDFLDID